MKSRFLHGIYLSLLLGSTFYFWRTLHSEKQLRAFLHRPADETYTVMRENNLIVKDYIQRNVSGYRSDHNLRTRQRVFRADTLVNRALNGRLSGDSLRSSLDTLAGGNKMVVNILAQVLLPQTPHRLSAEARLLMAQNDSLRHQLALTHIQHYFAQQVSGLDIKFDAFELVFSPTTLCPGAGQPFGTDVILSDNPSWVEVREIRVNGEVLPVEDGLGIYRHTFDMSGEYPLIVEAKAQAYRSPKDSTVIAKKTFRLHVNN